MLVLSRKKRQGICLGDSTRIVVVSIRGNKVRLGIDAPKTVRVLRDEVAARIAAGESLRDIEDDLDHRDNTLNSQK